MEKFFLATKIQIFTCTVISLQFHTMHRNYLTFLILAASISLICSCEVVVPIEGAPHIVVQSFFSPEDKELIVTVTESNSRVGTADTIYVENATVSLYDGNDLDNPLTYLELIRMHGKAYYRTVDLQLVGGQIYFLRVEIAGIPPITAIDTIPSLVPLKDGDTEIEKNSILISNTGASTVDFDVTVKINDPADIQNYYHILFKQELISEKEVDGVVVYDTILVQDERLKMKLKSKTLEIDQVFDQPSFILNDLGFNGIHEVILFNGDFTYDPSNYERGAFIIEMRTVSFDYYQHFLNFISEPTGDPLQGFDVIYDNINNGVGIFAGYSSSVSRLRLPN